MDFNNDLSHLANVSVISPAGSTISFASFGNVAPVVTLTTSTSAFSTDNTQLTLTQTGDTYGASSLSLQNRTGMNGPLYSQLGTVNVVDFGFSTPFGITNVLRSEQRPSYMQAGAGNATYGEFQLLFNSVGGGTFGAAFGTAGSTIFTPLTVTGTMTANSSLTVNGTATVNGTMTVNGGLETISGNLSVGGTDGITLTSSQTVLPVTPAANALKVFGKTLASREMLAIMDSDGMDSVLQPAMWRQKVSNWNPPGNATTIPGVFGMTAPTSIGTATARNVATTNLFTRARRLGYVSTSGAGNLCGHYIQQAQITTGDGTGLGGFFYSCRFGVSDTANPVGTRMFVGMSSSTAAPTNVEPSTIVNCFGIAQLSSSATQLYIVYGGSAAQTTIALGTNFPPYTGTGATLGVAYDVTFYSPSTASGIVYYRVERMGTAFIAEGTLTPTVVGTQTPAPTTLLAHRAWRTNNATAGIVGIDIIGFYTETDY
jgi:hypothetical protein